MENKKRILSVAREAIKAMLSGLLMFWLTMSGFWLRHFSHGGTEEARAWLLNTALLGRPIVFPIKHEYLVRELHEVYAALLLLMLATLGLLLCYLLLLRKTRSGSTG